MTHLVQSIVLSLGWLFGFDVMAVISSLTTNRTFGVEIEMVNLTQRQTQEALVNAGVPCQHTIYTHDVPVGFWRVVSDGSLRHLNCVDCCTEHTSEVVSPILSGISGLIQVVKVLWALKRAGADANYTCGIHVHVDAPEFWGKWNKFRQIGRAHV